MAISPARTASAWHLWQLLDSAFPAGGFAHSATLEAAFQAGQVREAAGVEAFARRRLREAAAGPLVFAREAHAAADDPTGLGRLQNACDAAASEPVARAASLRLGRGLLAAARGFTLPSLIAAERALSTGCHLPIAFGAVTAAAGLGERDALRGLLFSEARTVFSAAVRLGIAGPLDAQARLARLAPEAETLAETSRSIPPDAVHTTSPLLTLLGGEQPRLYSKLFQS